MDLHAIDLNLLVAFDALMAERSVTRAGNRIGRTQPAMSAALARLRALLQDELFVRGPHGLQPTPRALELAQPLSQALRGIQQSLASVAGFDPKTSRAMVTIGLSDYPAYILLPRLVAALRTEAPGIDLHVRGYSARDQAVSLLDAGEVELTVGMPISTVSARILTQPLFQERFVCILRRDHPAAQEPLTLDRFLSLTHLLVSPENERFGNVDAKLADMGLKRRLGLTIPQMHLAPALVAGSDLIATVLERAATASGYAAELAILPPPLTLEPKPFALMWHRRSDDHPVQKWLRGFIADMFARS